MGLHATSLAFSDEDPATSYNVRVTVKFTNTRAMEEGDLAKVKLTDFLGTSNSDFNSPDTNGSCKPTAQTPPRLRLDQRCELVVPGPQASDAAA